MEKTIGWSNSKIIDNQIFVLADNRDGSFAVYRSRYPLAEEMFNMDGLFQVPYTQEELAIKYGNVMQFEEAKEIFEELKMEKYVFN